MHIKENSINSPSKSRDKNIMNLKNIFTRNSLKGSDKEQRLFNGKLRPKYVEGIMQGGTETIKPYVDEFIAFAQKHTELYFYVTRIGCGIAGFTDADIAPLFIDAVNIGNVALPKSFLSYYADNGISEQDSK